MVFVIVRKNAQKKALEKGKNQCPKISFMIFRTGSVLIVGTSKWFILNKIYLFLKKIFVKRICKN